MTESISSVLFVCGSSQALSPMAEALLGRLGGGRFRSYSAAVRPAASTHPFAVEVIKSAGLRVTNLSPRTFQSFRTKDAPLLDFVIQLSDEADMARGYGWKGNPIIADWSIPDPCYLTGSQAFRVQGFRDSFKLMHRRIELFVTAQMRGLDRAGKLRELAKIRLDCEGTRAAANAA